MIFQASDQERNLKYLRYPDLVSAGIVSNRTTLHRWVQNGHFPQPVKLGPNSIAWRLADIEAFLERCAAGETEAAK